MKSLKVFIQILMLATLAASVTACSKKGGKSSLRGTQRNYDPSRGGVAPGANPQDPNSSGQIYNFNRQALAALMHLDESQFGEVSSQPGQQTGVFFDGYINDNGYGSLEVEVWDSYALQGQGHLETEPYQCQGQNVNNQLIISCYNSISDIVLSGYENNGVFSGQASIGNGASLGQFRISSCGFFSCY